VDVPGVFERGFIEVRDDEAIARELEDRATGPILAPLFQHGAVQWAEECPPVGVVVRRVVVDGR
jgi:hypothetical protein